MSLTILTPAYPPQISGVGDHSYGLVREIALRGGHVRVLVTHPGAKPHGALPEIPVEAAGQHSARELLERLSAGGCSQVFLAASLYGFQKRGCPFWLVNGLDRWLSGVSGAQLVTYFHELSARSTNPLTSSYWLAGVQARLCARLARLSRHCLANTPESTAVVDSVRSQLVPTPTRCLLLPVFSNLGEQPSHVPIEARAPRMIMYARSKCPLNEIIERYGKAITALAQRLDINELACFGFRAAPLPPQLGSMKIRYLDAPSSPELDELMSDSRVGVLSYRRDLLGKSGVYAAYCAHGLVPAVAELAPELAARSNGDSMPLHVLVPNEEGPSVSREDAARLARQAWEWYQPHTLARQAEVIMQLAGQSLQAQGPLHGHAATGA